MMPRELENWTLDFQKNYLFQGSCKAIKVDNLDLDLTKSMSRMFLT